MSLLIGRPMGVGLPQKTIHRRERVLSVVAMKTVSIDKAAELLCVSRRTIYNHIGRGVLKTVRTIGGGSQRVTLDSLTQWQASPQRRGERMQARSA